MIARQLKYEFKDTLFSMIIGWAINSAMILMAAATFFQPQNAKQVDDLATAGKMLTPLLGNAASVILQQRFCSPEFHRASPREWRRNDFFGDF